MWNIVSMRSYVDQLQETNAHNCNERESLTRPCLHSSMSSPCLESNFLKYLHSFAPSFFSRLSIMATVISSYTAVAMIRSRLAAIFQSRGHPGCLALQDGTRSLHSSPGPCGCLGC